MADLTKVQQAVQSVGASSGVRNLSARANGNSIEIHGTVHSLAEKQAVMRAITERVGDVGLMNHIEVAAAAQTQSTPQPRPMQQQVPPLAAPGVQHATEIRTPTVKKGETLTHIAQHYYGKASEYKKIFEANRDHLTDPDKVREGMTLRIP
ncbi:MAG TPA: LysM peptidoglycan-binding domain-containing protein [Thermoanaerobaculia bacterium]|nr:LysM peptidoglycan-binding domain-containing protein [Thermoanaerobaculia bacterium]